MIQYFQTAKRLSIFLFGSFISSTGWVYAQAPILKPDAKSANNIARIDSLTQNLYSEIPSHITPDWVANDEINESVFKEAMKMLGSSIPFEYHELVEDQIRYFA